MKKLKNQPWGAVLIIVLLLTVVVQKNWPTTANAALIDEQQVEPVPTQTQAPTPVPTPTALQITGSLVLGNLDPNSVEIIQLTEYDIQIVTSKDPNYDGQDAQIYDGPPPPPSSGSFGPPCPPGETFYNPGYYKYTAAHPGEDGRCTKNGGRDNPTAEIAAMADGKVSKYFPFLSPNTSTAGFYWVSGMTYIIQHNIEGRTCYTIYGHLSQGYLGAGADVKAGQPIGVIGNTGISDVYHLHVGLFCYQGSSLVSLNPSQYVYGTR